MPLITEVPATQEEITKAASLLTDLGQTLSASPTANEVKTGLQAIKSKLQASPTLAGNEVFTDLTNLVVGQLTLEQFRFEHPLVNTFTNMKELFGDQFQFTAINLPLSVDYDPLKWNPEDGQSYQPDMTQLYISTTLKKVVNYETELDIALGAFTSILPFNSFYGVYMGKPLKRIDLDFFNAIAGAFPLLGKKPDGTANPTQNIAISIPTDSKADVWLKVIWETAYQMSLPSTNFNGLGYQGCSDPENLIMVINSKYLTQAQFEAFAPLFNQEFINITNITKRVLFLTPEVIGADVIAYLVDRDAVQNVPRFNGAFSDFHPRNKKFYHTWHYWARIGVVISQQVVKFTKAAAAGQKAQLLPTHPDVLACYNQLKKVQKSNIALLAKD